MKGETAEINSNKPSKELMMSSQTSRIVHLIIDSISALILGAFFLIVIDLTYKDPFDESIELFSQTMVYLIMLSYYFIMEYKFQKTLGKFLTKSRVVHIDGSKPKLSDILLRTLCRLIPFEWLSYLFSNDGFHCKLSNTRVVKD